METLLVVAAYGLAGAAPIAAAKVGMDLSRIRPALGWVVTFSCMYHNNPWLRLMAVPHAAFALFTMGNPYVFFRKMLHFPALASMAVTAVGVFAPHLLPAANANVSALAIMIQLVHFLMGFARFMLLPAPLVSSIADIDTTREKFLKANAGWERVSFPCSSHNGVTLDGMIFQNPAAKGKRWVIYLGGNGEVYEHTTDIVSPIAQHMHANVFVYNPRGVGHSGGEIRMAEDLVNDASDAVKFLQQRVSGLRESQILLYGHSIGGGVAAQLVSRKHKECSVVLDRTFGTLVDAAVSLGPIKNRAIAEIGLGYIFGDLNTVAAVPTFTHKRVLFTFHAKDGILRHKESSLCGMHGDMLKKLNHEVIEFAGPAGDPHNVPPSTFAEFAKVVSSCDKFFYDGEGRKLGGSS